MAGRYYNIQLTGLGTGASSLTQSWSSLKGSAGSGTTSLLSSDAPDPGALNVEFDFYTTVASQPAGTASLTIWGVALTDLLQAAQYGPDFTTGRKGAHITVKAGMSPGLPLATLNAGYAGTILEGEVYQSFGNWQTTDMTLDLIINAAAFSYDNPGNFTLNWPRGTSLKVALAQCLNIAYPTFTQTLDIGDEYILSYDVQHSVNTLKQLSQMVNLLTKQIIAETPGVQIAILPGKIRVFDGSIPLGAPIQLQFTDLIGQPTWIGQNTMQVQTVMRSDIQVGSTILMPVGLKSGPGSVILTGSSLPSSVKYTTAFQGLFTVQSVRQVGNFRDAQGTSWVSVFNCTPQGSA